MFNRLASASLLAGLAVLCQPQITQAAAITYTDFGLFQSATFALTTDNFDSSPWIGGTIMPQPASNLGVSWTAANDLLVSTTQPRSGSNVISSLDGGPDTIDWIEAALPGGTTAVGAWVMSYNQLHDTDLLAYDALDNLLGSVSLGVTGNDYMFFGITSTTAIAKVRFVATAVPNDIADDFALDDFTFGTADRRDTTPVPEPGTLALFGTALLGLAAIRRRTTRRA